MITERMQRKAIYDQFIAKTDTDLDHRKFSEPWRSIFAFAKEDELRPIIGLSPLRAAIQDIAKDRDQADALMREINAASEPPHFPNAIEMAEQLDAITWVWEDWIPRGMLSLIGGYPGTGKSYFVMDLVRNVIAGDQWPDGKSVERTGSVIYVDAEGVPQINSERVQKLGIDGRQLYFLTPEDGHVLDLTQRYWQDKLIEMVLLLKPELIIVDSLSAISLKGMNGAEDVSPLLTFLVAIARHGDCGMLLVHHLRKPPTGQLSLYGVTIHDFRNSQHIIAYSRTVMGISVVQKTGEPFTLNGERRLDMVKTNFSKWTDSLGLALEEDGGRVKFVYAEAPRYQRDISKQEACELWLTEYLEENGPSKPSDVVEFAEEEGYNQRMVFRARKARRDTIYDTDKPRSRANKWTLDEPDPH